MESVSPNRLSLRLNGLMFLLSSVFRFHLCDRHRDAAATMIRATDCAALLLCAARFVCCDSEKPVTRL